MPLQQFFEAQVDSLRDFFNAPGFGFRILLTDPDTLSVTQRMLAGMENDPENQAVLIPSDAAFKTVTGYCQHVLADLHESYEPFAKLLEAEYILPPPSWASLHHADPVERLMNGLARFANALPDDVGAVVMILCPSQIDDAVGYRKCLETCRKLGPKLSKWLKLLVLDDRLKGATVELVMDDPDLDVQSTYLPPAEIERRAKTALETGVLTPAEQRSYAGLVASFALARKDHDAALALYQRQLQLTQKQAGGSPSDLTSVHYNLGNAHLAKGDLPAALQSLTTSLELAIKANMNSFVPMILTNMGVVLFQANELGEAKKAFGSAQQYAQKLNQPPTEAHILDCMAKCHNAAKQPTEAEKCWNEALAVYDKITAPTLQMEREAGKKLIYLQLEQHYQSQKNSAGLAKVRKELSHGSA